MNTQRNNWQGPKKQLKGEKKNGWTVETCHLESCYSCAHCSVCLSEDIHPLTAGRFLFIYFFRANSKLTFYILQPSWGSTENLFQLKKTNKQKNPPKNQKNKLCARQYAICNTFLRRPPGLSWPIALGCSFQQGTKGSGNYWRLDWVHQPSLAKTSHQHDIIYSAPLQLLSTSPARIVFEPPAIIIKIKCSQSLPTSARNYSLHSPFRRLLRRRRKLLIAEWRERTNLLSSHRGGNKHLKQEQLVF